MRVLAATRNRDKYAIVKRMIEAAVPDAFLYSLEEGEVDGDVVEVGSIQDRARQKASYFADRLEQIGRGDEFEAVLGIDDGLSIAGGPPSPNSKELTDRILRGEWEAGTAIDVIRAFALIRRGERARVEVTRVPFVFLGNPDSETRIGGKYPLSNVLSPVGYSVAVSKLDQQEEDRVNLSYSAQAIESLFS